MFKGPFHTKHGGIWHTQVGHELNLTVLLGLLFTIIFYEAPALVNIPALYLIVRAVSGFLTVYYIGSSLLLTKKIFDKLYK